MRSTLLFILNAAVCGAAVTTVHVPNGGIQPQVVERDGIVHLVYFAGDAQKGDLFYVRSRDYGATFSKPIPVNHTPSDAMAVGNIRGAQMAVGRNGRVHIAWNGTEPTTHIPMLYTRLNDNGTAFEPERNLIHNAWGLDGGGSLAADADGNVYVFWHAPIPGQKGEQNRRVWVARSPDDGKTFEAEHLAFDKPIGACGCCGMKAFADGSGIHVLFREADQITKRDIWLLTSTDHGKTFTGNDISHWNIGACVMSSADLTASSNGLLAAWESEKQTYFGRVEGGQIVKPIAAPGVAKNRKYPVLAANARGETLFAWTEGTAWKKGGSVEWQVFDKDGKALAEKGTEPGFPVWSLVAAFAKPDGNFVIVW
jgi:hypothetical protein